jgi:glycosyltransferase involved in cell wall biosynthesis
MEEQLKFCMITTFYPPYSFGGDAIYIYRLSNELARRGHHVDVIHCEDSYRLLERNKMKPGYPNHENVHIHRMKSGYGFLSPLLTQQSGKPFFKLARIKRLLESNNYDVIHYHNMSLIGISTIHFVRWLIIDNGRRLMMVSDYDGSWEAYIDEFAEMIVSGLDAIWETAIGVPPDGARDLPAFKRFLRTHQVPAEVFFAAYPNATVLNVAGPRESGAPGVHALDTCHGS